MQTLRNTELREVEEIGVPFPRSKRTVLADNHPSWLQMALHRSIVQRGLRVSGVVGTLLVIINHLPALWGGDLSRTRIFQIGLTYLVPYCVATWSSVSALREAAKKATSPPTPETPADRESPRP